MKQAKDLLLEMGHIIRLLDEDCNHIEEWANDGNKTNPEDYVPDSRFHNLVNKIQELED